MAPAQWPVVKQGQSGARVSAVQHLLRARGATVAPDGIFGPQTHAAVQQFQTQNGVGADGIVGNQTWPLLVIQTGPGDTGDKVRAVQVLFRSLAQDGIYGSNTAGAVAIVQQLFGLNPDGIAGAQTWPALVSPDRPMPTDPATAVIEPDSVGGIPLGATAAEVEFALGTPTTRGRVTDLHGREVDFRTWQIQGDRGLVLSFPSTGASTPRVHHWSTHTPGPSTAKGVQVGDPASKVTAAYGPLEPFVVAGSHAATVERGGGTMVVVVDDASQQVDVIIGGDRESWMGGIAT